ncbi:unannotated protein [freshwater metagenome]|uniref:Unannotated protein n=1 Tax=freshwater metagenome TaxID=449393 RepID=A0A6J6VDQ0_9ZZZZ|nr:ABC transporter permease [Actinomycetota bacterium]MSV64175.1 ABC transporter permease [Actinomycetota bacterium]MSW25944.1 ABC transporter permease [Actinomycetota bacterium]MSW33921.1 ABC transporter permease [Actinomycetota bacterium]MSX30906.1 ABC transporter permease [Actinomycetota bacterium]
MGTATPVEVFVPFRKGLPPLRKYWSTLWKRRSFIAEYSRTQLHEQHFDSVFGQIWLILNPLLLSGVYFVLIVIIGGHSDKMRYGHLTACLFLFYLMANTLSGGVKSVTSGQRLILNTAFPRLMLPISASVVAFFRFLPTIFIFLILRTILGLPIGWNMLWSIPIVLIAILFSSGVAILISCINVYFRDIANFLPYFTRMLLYLSPILWETSAIKPQLRKVELVNPLFPLLDSWSRAVVHAQAPHLTSMLISLAWAVLVFTFGTYFFLVREREFAVRV